MSRKLLIAGNWKMNGLSKDGALLAKTVAQDSKKISDCDFLVCPPATLLCLIKKCLRGSKVFLGAQDIHFETKGAHTGDISPLMLKDAGCKFVIVGHSERRADHLESNELVCKKAKAAQDVGLTAIVCIGETAAQRDEGKTIDVCTNQIMNSVPEKSTYRNLVIAYEPVWAIGSGKTPTSTEVEAVHAAVRKALGKKLTKAQAAKIRILYGGSVKPNNAKEFLSLEDVDGALVGGASLKAEDFIAIAMNACC